MAEAAGGAAMRVDRFLWFARLARSRPVAQALATSGRLRLDGRVVDRASASLKVGAVLAFAAPDGRIRAIRVAALPARRGPPQAGRACYIDLLETAAERSAGD